MFVGYIPIHKNSTNSSMVFYQVVSAQGNKINNSKSLLVWLQGGPGCSSWAGNLQEFGPFKIINKTNGNGTIYQTIEANKYTWAKDFNLLFVDQPIGVGYSILRGSDAIPSSAQGQAQNFENFMIGFYNVYPEFKQNPLFITGESFAGHYVPAYASHIIMNKEKNGINIAGVSIGDGWVDPFYQGPVYSNYAFSAGIISNGRRKIYKRYENLMIESLLNGDIKEAVNLFNIFSNGDGSDNLVKIGGNVDNENYRDYTNPLSPSVPFSLWLNLESTKRAFNIPQNLSFTECNNPIYAAFTDDIAKSYQENITVILENTKLLLYNGQDDLVIPTPGTADWIQNLQWKGMDKFKNLPKKIWEIDGKVVGNYKQSGSLSYFLVNKAGHMVPHDAPLSALNMLRTFSEEENN